MKKHPVTVPRNYYRGRDARCLREQREFNRVAASVERHINALVDEWSDAAAGSIMSYEVASARPWSAMMLPATAAISARANRSLASAGQGQCCLGNRHSNYRSC